MQVSRCTYWCCVSASFCALSRIFRILINENGLLSFVKTDINHRFVMRSSYRVGFKWFFSPTTMPCVRFKDIDATAIAVLCQLDCLN